jgi:hypothetical protein
VICINVPVHVVSVMNKREHWSVKAKRAKLHRSAAHWALTSRQRPALPCVVTLTRIAPRELDGDNLQGGLKACRDGVADWLGLDDRDPRVTWQYGQRKGKPREYAVEVEIA